MLTQEGAEVYDFVRIYRKSIRILVFRHWTKLRAVPMIAHPSISIVLHSESFGKPGSVRKSLSGRIADQYSTEPAKCKASPRRSRPKLKLCKLKIVLLIHNMTKAQRLPS
jgi:hypothetical protein